MLLEILLHLLKFLSLKVLVKDKEKWVREAVLRNPNSTDDEIKKIVQALNVAELLI